MKNRTDAAARRTAVLSAAVVALIAPAVAAHAAVPPPASVSVPAHSPTGSCVRATVLAFQTRHALAGADHLAEALGVALAHRHSACPALVDYLKQSSA